MGAQSRASLLKKNYYNDVEISESKSNDPFVSLSITTCPVLCCIIIN